MTEFSQNFTGAIQPLLMTPDLKILYNDLHCSVYTNPGNDVTDPTENLFSIDLCYSGRCEFWLDGGNYDIIMNPGYVGLGAVEIIPTRFYYPLGYYKGLKIIFNSRIFDQPGFQKFTDGFSWEPFEKRLEKGAVIIQQNEELNNLIASLQNLSGEQDLDRYWLRLMEIFLLLGRVNLTDASSVSHLTRKQNEIAKLAHDRLANHPEAAYKVQKMADDLHVSVSSLNQYFRACYGDPIPTWIRKYRLNLAADLLRATDRTVAEIATSVGYANISKFSAAFRRQFSMPPSVYRKYHA